MPGSSATVSQVRLGQTGKRLLEYATAIEFVGGGPSAVLYFHPEVTVSPPSDFAWLTDHSMELFEEFRGK